MGEDDDEEKPPDVYEGTMEHGVRQGKGTYTWSNGSTYTGEYKEGKKSGQGKMKFPDKGVYEGEWQDDQPHGSGTYTYPNGDVYQGGFQAGKRHGKGMYHYKAPCAQLVGDWSEGAFAYGRWVFRDGSMFMGKFGADGQPNSQPDAGSYYFAGSGLTQEGHTAKDGAWVAHADPVVGQPFTMA
ncbi:hypothetical protein HYH03_015696 [Edaphochlamys debaryana]|nr:hypothetical protein HYH03_015696 [Edaphochlamys debaryana]|eukprot:KAG2485636.1 hypothetical protein HYH03_015696 [Edaphochlamys debaryana]